MFSLHHKKYNTDKKKKQTSSISHQISSTRCKQNNDKVNNNSTQSNNAIDIIDKDDKNLIPPIFNLNLILEVLMNCKAKLSPISQTEMPKVFLTYSDALIDKYHCHLRENIEYFKINKDLVIYKNYLADITQLDSNCKKEISRNEKLLSNSHQIILSDTTYSNFLLNNHLTDLDIVIINSLTFIKHYQLSNELYILFHLQSCWRKILIMKLGKSHHFVIVFINNDLPYETLAYFQGNVIWWDVELIKNFEEWYSYHKDLKVIWEIGPWYIKLINFDN